MLLGLGIALMLVPLLIVVHVDAALLESHKTRFRNALRLADISLEQASEWQGIDKNQSRRQWEGEGHISLTRMMLLPPIFWQWWALLLAEDYGIPRCITRGMRILMVVRNRRQLRMAEPVSAESRIACSQ